MVKKPVMATLNLQQREDVISTIRETAGDFEYKEIALEVLDFYSNLLEEAKNSKLSLGELKQLIGFRNEQLKKLSQM